MLSCSGDARLHGGLLPHNVYCPRSRCLYEGQNGLLRAVVSDEGVPKCLDDPQHETEVPGSPNAFAFPFHHLLASEHSNTPAGARDAK